MSSHNTILWREWGDEAFAEAKSQDKPILLDIGAVWCHWCHVMDDGIPGDPVHTGTYSTPEVQQRIQDNFIPIKVDNDRRPDINARYNMGGWPTTAFLTPEGATLYGETYVTPSRMIGLLDHITEIYKNSKDQIAEQTAEVSAQRTASENLSPSALDAATTEMVLVAIRRNFDPQFGGFGREPKFPHPDTLRLVLETYAATKEIKLREIAEKTLHGMADGGMYDRFAGGFFRYSTTRDWSIPHFEKMLEDNAKLTSVYCLAAQVLGDVYYLDVVKSAHGWLLSDMRDSETGAFAGSQDADKEEAYYGEPLSVRSTLPTPYIDRAVYTNWNSLMVSALVARYKITGEEAILDAAVKAFAFLVPSADHSTNLPHSYDGNVPQKLTGLLVDITPTLHAALDLSEVTGKASYQETAQILGNRLLSTLVDADGGFMDSAPHPDAIGELARPKKEIGENADAALALVRLSGLTEDARYKQAAEQALKLFADKYAAYGYFSASYARAVEAVKAPGLHVTIVGAGNTPEARKLQEAAWGFIAPSKTVETLDFESAAKRGLPTDLMGKPYATVCVGTVCFAPVSGVEEMLSQMRGAE